jgi:cytochrome c peroxidase
MTAALPEKAPERCGRLIVEGAIKILLVALALALSTPVFMARADDYDESEIQDVEPILPLPKAPALDPDKVALGERLFNDPILSGRKKFACSSCHDLSSGGTIRLPRTIGYNGKMHDFNAPTLFNVAVNYRLGWRGSFTKLEDQNDAVMIDPNLMAADWPALVETLNESTDYRRLFRKIYRRRIDRADVLDALVTFQRSLVTPDARFDRYLRGDATAISELERHGYMLFKTYGCTSCHQGRNIGGNLFEKFGVFRDAAAPTGGQRASGGSERTELGRFAAMSLEEDKSVFRVPSLRNVAITAPYFHDGRVWSLASAVRLMSKLQLGRTAPPEDIDAMVAFLRTLTGEYKGRSLGDSK